MADINFRATRIIEQGKDGSVKMEMYLSLDGMGTVARIDLWAKDNAAAMASAELVARTLGQLEQRVVQAGAEVLSLLPKKPIQ